MASRRFRVRAIKELTALLKRWDTADIHKVDIANLTEQAPEQSSQLTCCFRLQATRQAVFDDVFEAVQLQDT
jgi:hypothetical protein